MQTFKLRQTTEKMEDPAHWKIMLKGYLEHQKATPRGPDLSSICDELGVRMCLFGTYLGHGWFRYNREEN